MSNTNFLIMNFSTLCLLYVIMYFTQNLSSKRQFYGVRLNSDYFSKKEFKSLDKKYKTLLTIGFILFTIVMLIFIYMFKAYEVSSIVPPLGFTIYSFIVFIYIYNKVKNSKQILSLDNNDSKQSVLGGGGRYNKLIKELDGPESYGIGWACGKDRIINILKEMPMYQEIKKQVDVYVMYVSEEEKLYSLDIVQNLRLNGVSCETDNLGRGLKGQFKQADRLNAKFLIILNNEDLQKGLVNVKDNATKEEEKVDLAEITEYIIGSL